MVIAWSFELAKLKVINEDEEAFVYSCAKYIKKQLEGQEKVNVQLNIVQ